MRTGYLILLTTALLIGGDQHSFGQGTQPILLYPDGVPDTNHRQSGDSPILVPYLSDLKFAHSAVMICPGGGYSKLATDHEGKQIAEWYCRQGVSAFVLHYRLGSNGFRHPAMLQDAKRGMRLIRFNAQQWNIDPDRIGVMGFSAGGHLASTLATQFDSGNRLASESVEQFSSRPDFLVLAYPVISMQEYAHQGSKTNLLGNDPDQAIVNSLSNHKQVKHDSPPTFLFHANDDQVVPPENSVLYYLALRRHGIPAELHVYEKGGHGFGFADNDPVLSTWRSRLKDWLKTRQILSSKK